MHLMLKQLFIIFQKITPQHSLTALVGWLANIKNETFKNLFIRCFIKHYRIDMQEAAITDPTQYATFNDFFIRKLKPALRPLDTAPAALTSPVDGTVAQLGSIAHNQLLQAKNFYFNLETLLGGDHDLATYFYDGLFATLYLAPYNYHRVHMPFDGELIKTIYVPGKLFSVNRITTDLVPALYSRNERLICIFNTAQGQMAVILVGALIVGSIQTVWMDAPIRRAHLHVDMAAAPVKLAKGAELGYFKLGSTVILLGAKDAFVWNDVLKAGDTVQMGKSLATLSLR